jgi:hypothetical protein
MHHTEHMKPDSLSMGEELTALTLSAELAALTRHQYESLLKSSFALMTIEESGHYDERRLRIAEICDALAKYRKTSALTGRLIPRSRHPISVQDQGRARDLDDRSCDRSPRH